MINFENYTYILTNETPEHFTKAIEKENFNNITFKLLTITDIEGIANLMQIEEYKYCYSIQENRFYEISDLLEILE